MFITFARIALFVAAAICACPSFSYAAPAISDEASVEAEAQIQGEAPFNLSWGMSKEQVEASGIKLAPYRGENAFGLYVAAGFKEMFPGVNNIYLYFGSANRLWNVVAASKYFGGDPLGVRVMEDYSVIKSKLQKVYGPGIVKQEDDSSVGKDRSNFLRSLLLGKTVRQAEFEDGDVYAKIAVGAHDFSTGYFVVIFKHKALAKESERGEARQP